MHLDSLSCNSPEFTISHRPQDWHECETRLAHLLITHGSSSLERLLVLQEKGWNDISTERHFRKQRHTADTASRNLNMVWFRRMKNLFGEIDRAVDVVPLHQPLRFLDLGCCPGGFSSYILDKNDSATGVGISLPVEEGGHEFSLEHRNRNRYDLLYANLTYFKLGPYPPDDTRFTLEPLPCLVASESFDLILLDEHQLRTQTSSAHWDKDRLLISQLIIALQSVKKDGTIVVKLPLPHRQNAARILVLLNILSSGLSRWKPLSMHANRGQFYAIAKGVGSGQMGADLQHYVDRLAKLWSSLTFEGEERSGRPMVPEDLDFIIPMEELMKERLEWLRDFGDPLWSVQRDALEGFYRQRGI